MVTLRGKKYDVKGATSVSDVQKSVEEQAGLAKEQQVRTAIYAVVSAFICSVDEQYGLLYFQHIVAPLLALLLLLLLATASAVAARMYFL